MYEKELKEVKKELKKFNDELNYKAQEIEINTLFNRVKDKYNYDLPFEYYQFLKECNGFEFNGHIIYGTESFIRNNEDYEQICNEKYIIIGEYDIGFFVIKKRDNSYCELDRSAADEIRKFESIEEMIKYILIESIKWFCVTGTEDF